MKKTIIKSTPLAALAVALAVLFAANDFQSLDNKVDFVKTASVGELVELTAPDADAWAWQILPETKNYKLINSGRTLIFSAEEKGSYIFVCAYSQGNQVKLVVHKIIVGSKNNNNSNSAFDKLVKSWLPKGYTKDDAHRLANAFQLATVKEHSSVAELIRFSSISNRAALGDDYEQWKPFLKDLSNYCKQNYQGKSLEDHINLWLYVAGALRKA